MNLKLNVSIIKRTCLRLILLYAFACKVFSQNDTLPNQPAVFSFGIIYHKGFIIPHSESIRSISYSKPWIIETDFFWHFTDQNAWEYCFCYPRIGLSLLYIDFDNPEILGHAICFAPYIEPFFHTHRRFTTSFRFAAGYAYLDNIYDSLKNPQNLFYSTHSSFILSLYLAVNYRVGLRCNLRLSGCYNHISNGGNKIPNKGINFPTAAIGIDYMLKPVLFPARKKLDLNYPLKRSLFTVGLLGTFKKPFQDENTQYFLYGCHFNWSYLLGRLSALTTGIEFVNDGSLKEILRQKYMSPPDHKRVGVLAGHELQIGRFRFSQQLGIYLYSPAKAKDPVYQRWGLNFLIYKGFFIGTNLKAHRHVADFMDLRIGIEL